MNLTFFLTRTPCQFPDDSARTQNNCSHWFSYWLRWTYRDTMVTKSGVPVYFSRSSNRYIFPLNFQSILKSNTQKHHHGTYVNNVLINEQII